MVPVVRRFARQHGWGWGGMVPVVGRTAPHEYGMHGRIWRRYGVRRSVLRGMSVRFPAGTPETQATAGAGIVRVLQAASAPRMLSSVSQTSHMSRLHCGV